MPRYLNESSVKKLHKNFKKANDRAQTLTQTQTINRPTHRKCPEPLFYQDLAPTEEVVTVPPTEGSDLEFISRPSSYMANLGSRVTFTSSYLPGELFLPVTVLLLQSTFLKNLLLPLVH